MDVWQGDIEAEQFPLSQVLCLMSDLHLEAEEHDREMLISDLEMAKKLGARVSINGDLIDGILPSDRKRYHPMVERKNSERRDAILNATVKEAVNVLSPYADLIDVISPGNHERSILKHHHFDILSAIISGLNAHRSENLLPIHRGGYRGFQLYRLRMSGDGGPNTRLFTIFRHHGRGGAAQVTGGALDLDRLRKDFEADLYWVGHKHGSIQRAFSRFSLTPRGNLFERKQRAVMSAGYKTKVEKAEIIDDEDDYDVASFSETFYNTSQTGAQWVLLEARSNAVDGESNGFVRGLRWNVLDSPYPLFYRGA